MIELLVVGATLLVAAGASGAQAHRRTRAARVLAQYAHVREHRFIPAPKRPRGSSPRVEGTRDDVAFVLDFYRLGGNLRTRVCVLTKGRAPKIIVAQRSAFSRTFDSDRGAVTMGDESFDRAYRVTCNAVEDAEVLGPETRKSLLRLDRRSDVWLESNGSKVVLSWAGIEMDPLCFDAARDAVCNIASAHRPDSPYR
jgi:hypothetical protein